jgi:hypothetical protein
VRCNREEPARHAVAGIPSGEARDAARSATSERMAVVEGDMKRIRAEEDKKT